MISIGHITLSVPVSQLQLERLKTIAEPHVRVVVSMIALTPIITKTRMIFGNIGL